jgi:ubiquinone/menaquinone biosynthesis C-methylase UbiE
MTAMTQVDRHQERDRHLQRGYDREAQRYDARRYHSAEGQFFSDLELTVLRAWLQPESGTKILDVPAGTGRLSMALAQTGATVIAGDISHNMLTAAASKARTQKSGVQFAQVNAAGLPFADNTFDAVASFKFFHLIPNDRKKQFVREMARVLKPGKKMVLEFNSPFYGGLLAFVRYYFRKQKPGGMRMKCIFPDQIGPLFEGLTVTRKYGVKLPFSGFLSSVFGRGATEKMNLWFGRMPAVRYFAYAILIEAEKPLS